jgi:hypothetical protein
MAMLQETEDMRLDAQLHLSHCCTCSGAHYVEISVIRFNSKWLAFFFIIEILIQYLLVVIEKLNVWLCKCSPVACQLVRSGLFPCAPFSPSLAVDIRMLDLLTRLFLRVSPNVTAWCSVLEEQLHQQGYWLQGQDPLRRRFGNCLLWYQTLKDSVNSHTKSVLEEVRQEMLDNPPSPVRSDEALHVNVKTHLTNPHLSPSDITRKRKRDQLQATYEGQDDGIPNTSLPPPPRSPLPPAPDPPPDPPPAPDTPPNPPPTSNSSCRASAYLRSRCALCFGGTQQAGATEAGPCVIVLLDACFTHKHRDRHGRDPPRFHPDTFFLREEEVRRWEAKLEEAHSAKPSKQSKTSTESQDDHYEHGMRVPKSALDVCLGSFTAAHETLAKALCSGYDNTGDAALVCPHDAALFLVGMDSPGERQHYMFALLAEFFKHIPENWDVGILYDIGCQTERSCLKWGLLKKYLHRIIWGVSVFHAYGHIWACQVIYHPRKRCGFGLCDGEGCERCWSCLSHLVAYTRVVGVRISFISNIYCFTYNKNV